MVKKKTEMTEEPNPIGLDKPKLSFKKIEDPEKLKRLAVKSGRSGSSGEYFRILSAICKQPKGSYVIERGQLKLKSIYPSFEKVIFDLATKKNPEILTKKETKEYSSGKKYVTYPLFSKWKEANLHLKTMDGELYIVKVTNDPI